MQKIENKFCNNCQNKTDHDVLYSNEIKGNEPINASEPYEEQYYINWSNTYTLYECKGCHEIHLEKVFWFSEDDGLDITVYPPRIARKTPIWIDSVPDKQKELLIEIYKALAADCKQLAVMGTRSLIDLFMLNKLGDIGSFERKMEVLQEQGLISKNQKEYLTAALETGHAVVHRGFIPSDDVVNKVLDIVENILMDYSLQKKGKDLKRITPKRKKIDKTKTVSKIKK